MYALRHIETHELVRYHLLSKNADGTEIFTLSSWLGGIWVVDEEYIAIDAISNSYEDWWFTGYETPMNPFLGELEVVRLTVGDRV